jgi:hypothetical protein
VDDEQTIEVRYAGAVVARSAAVSDASSDGFFLGVSDPLPVGTVVSLTIDGAAKMGRVEKVFESPETTLAGMRIQYVDGAPARRAAAVPAPVPTPAPASAPAPAAPVALSDDEGTADVSGPTDAGGGDGNQGMGSGGGGSGRRRRRRR